jgi:hypothetical protein
MAFANTHSITNRGATSIFVMTGIPMSNIRPGMDPISINLPNGDVMRSMHIYDIIILGLLIILTGNIVPYVSYAKQAVRFILPMQSVKSNTKIRLFCMAFRTPPPTFGPSPSLQLP